MEGLWTFCPSSEPYLKRCLELAGNSKNNKWAEFLTIDLSDEMDITVNDQNMPTTPAVCTVEEDSLQLTTESAEIVSEICDCINDLDNHFSFITDKLSKNPILFSIVATKITGLTAEKFCNKIYSTECLDNNLILGYYKYFLPAFLRHDHTRFSVDTLVRAYAKHHVEFKNTCLPLILKDVKIPKTILLDFVSQLDTKDESDIFKFITEMTLDKTEFVELLNIVNVLYKACEATPSVQNFILTNLISCADLCTNNKMFGQLLFAYLKTDCDFKLLENVINNHCSAFKRPCLNLLQKLNSKKE